MALEPRSTSHLYPIANESYEWVCGTDAKGLQVFLYQAHDEHVTAIFFKNDGTLDSTTERKIPLHAPRGGPGWSEAKERNEQETMAALKREIGFSPGSIQVRRVAAADLRIEDWPALFMDFVNNPDHDEPNASYRDDLGAEVDRWRREGCFVLWLGKDYWMDGDGTIGST